RSCDSAIQLLTVLTILLVLGSCDFCVSVVFSLLSALRFRLTILIGFIIVENRSQQFFCLPCSCFELPGFAQGKSSDSEVISRLSHDFASRHSRSTVVSGISKIFATSF